MKRIVLLAALIAITVLFALPVATGTHAAGPEWIIVNAGETLTMIAARYGVSVEALMRVNNLPNANFVYSGQRLLIPDPLMVFSPQPPAQNVQPILVVQPQQPIPIVQPQQPLQAVYYTVRPGDTLAGIASRYGVSIAAIAQANNLTNWNFVWYGQRLLVPGTNDINGVIPILPAKPVLAPPGAPQPAAPQPLNPASEGKWIDVNVSNQSITAYEGNVAIKTILVSTGLPRTPTVLGTYKILSKYPAVRMTGGTPGIDYYDLPNVPYTMFFFRGYAIHGTYWHNNFGHPMSHGCVNLPTNEAKWFYEWAPIGTPVVTHR